MSLYLINGNEDGSINEKRYDDAIKVCEVFKKTRDINDFKRIPSVFCRHDENMRVTVSLSSKVCH